MSLRVVYTDDFPADLAIQFRWYTQKAGEQVALRYAQAAEETLASLAEHPHLGVRCDFDDPRLAELRFCVVKRPFHRHLLYYRIAGDDLIAFRIVPGERDLPTCLLERPGTE
jgi:plasmid stabilization system protein ParE